LTDSSQHRNASRHSHAARCTSSVTLTSRSRWASSNTRPIPRWSILRRNASLVRSCQPTHQLSPHCSLPGLRMTRRNLTSPLYFPLPVYMLVEHPPPEYAQSLDWVRDHHLTRHHHQSLTCTAVDAHGRCCRSCLSGVLACSQHRNIHQYRHEPLRLAVLHYYSRPVSHPEQV
jgi:hypothetical protein